MAGKPDAKRDTTPDTTPDTKPDTKPDTTRDELARTAWAALASLTFGEAMLGRVHDAAAAAGVPHPGALKALMQLEDGTSPPSMRVLAERMRCDASYITTLIDELETLGYVDRRVSEADRRVKLVELTRQGRRALAAAHDILERPPEALDRLTDAEVRTFARLTAKLVPR